MLDYEALMAPIDADAPCGPELRDDPEFRDIEDAPGDFANQKAPELLQVVARCDAFLARTKDHAPALVALQAAVRVGDWALANAAVALVKGFAEDYWDDFHPGPADEMAIARINELSALARPAALTLPLQRAALAALPAPSAQGFTAAMLAAACAPVLEWSSEDESALATQVENGSLTATAARAIRPTREGARTLRTIMRSLSADARAADVEAEAGGDDIGMSDDALVAVARTLRAQVEAARDAMQAMSDAFYDINGLYDSCVGDSASIGPVFAALKGIVEDASRFLDAFPEDESSADAELETDAGVVDGAEANAGSPVPRGFVSSVPQTRSDVLKAIDTISRYYSEKEPTSPVPLMLARLRTWVTMDFLELLQEIVPAAIDDANALLAVRPAETEY